MDSGAGKAAIDLRSDTFSMPTEAMLQSILTARLGNDSRDGDPTVMELEALAADMFGKEAAMLTPTGTMANLIALRNHTEAGATVIMEEKTHVYDAEYGGLAASCGLLSALVPGAFGAMDIELFELAIARAAAGFPARALVCLENSHNAAGGTVLTPAYTRRVCDMAHAAGLPVHLDGARIFNAAVAQGVSVRELTEPVDSLQFCLSKGLSCPVGSLLLGSRPFIARARKIRKMMGGAMRQAGIIAAPGLIALHTMVDRLAEDHDHARRLAQGIASLSGLSVNLRTVQTNMVRVDVAGLGIDAATFGRHLWERGVRCMVYVGTEVRFMTYRGITREHVDDALGIMTRLLAERPWTQDECHPAESDRAT
jgi:threonine aldolase